MQNILDKVINYKKYKYRTISFLSKNKRIIIPIIILLTYVFLYFFIDSSSQSLVAHDEGLYAKRSRLIEESSNWFSSPFIKPHHKTLGSYWFIALSIRLFGRNELALRLPSILSSFLCLISLYLITVKISNKKTAFIALFSLSSMPLWIQYSRYASPDIPFVLSILLLILFFLKFLDSTNNLDKYFYILYSGFFFSFSFFIRSYMAFIPLLGLSPFVIKHLLNSKNIFRIIFSTGILIGFIPTFLNLYFSYEKFGINGVSSLFDFAKRKAFEGDVYNNILLIPLNYFYLTFPIGILLVILLVFTRSKNKFNYPLLVYIYPLISFTILCFMSTSFPHYYLFLLPSLSIIVAIIIQSFSFRYSFSKVSIRYLLSFFVLLISFTILFAMVFFNRSIIEFSNGSTLLIYIISSFFVLSFIFSIRYLFAFGNKDFNLINFFYSIIIPQYISLSLLYNFGVLGNPNFKTKSFLRDKYVSSIVKENTIYFYKLDSKIETLLSYYLPSSKIIKSSESINNYKYIVTSDSELINNLEDNSGFRVSREFDDNFLLINISK